MNLSPLRQLYCSYLGRMYVWAYWANLRRFLGPRVSSWLKTLSLTLVGFVWIMGWGQISIFLAGLLAVWLFVTFWRAKRAGYKRFVADETAVMPPDEELVALPPNEKVPLRATGHFSLSDREDFVLLRPALYWQIPLGEHAVMVEQVAGHYLYQFFQATDLQKAEPGHLIFGATPRLTLAVTFLVSWGPNSNNDSMVTQFYFGSDPDTGPKREPRTIYFSFDDEDARRLVWHNIIADARRVREQRSP